MKVLFLFFTDPPRPFSSSVAQLAAVVRAAGHEPSALELSCKGSIASAVDEIARRAPDVLAVSAMTRDWPGARALVERLPSRARPFVVVGGYHATLATREVAASPAVDAICIGEGERPLRTLLDRLAHGAAGETFPGMWLRTGDAFAGEAPAADAEPDIASLPAWDYDVFGDVGAHLTNGINTFGPHVDRYLPVRASRGCPYTCAYCSAPTWGAVNGVAKTKRNVRPVEHLCAELASLRDRYSPDGFEFWDEHFPISIEWLRELAEVYPRRVARPFKVEMHPSAASTERLELLKRAGCTLFHCGVEAGDEQLRRNTLNRRTRDAELQRVFDDCRRIGLATSASLMTVLPGETRAQMRTTTELLRKLRPGSFMWSTYQPLPSTPLGEAAVDVWPGPSRETFDDYEKHPSRTPALVTDPERYETFRELNALQAELVERATTSTSRPRPIDVPAPRRAPSPELLAMLGLPASMRVQSAWWERDALALEIAEGSAPPRRISICANNGGRFYRSTPRLGVSYSGAEAPVALLRALDALAIHLEKLGIEDLQQAVSR